MEGTLRVIEIFRSIQGEGTRAGLPCAFVRLARCNLRCRYCDTRYAAEEDGTTMHIAEVCDRVAAHCTNLVCLTGGEPLLQEGAAGLAARLATRGHTVVVETNGTLDMSVLPAGIIRIMDVKCPGSGECGKTLPGNLDALTPQDEVKLVLCSRADFDWACVFVRTHDLAARCHVLFSPAWGFLFPADLASWILESGMEVRLQVQLHKVLWPDRNRGV